MTVYAITDTKKGRTGIAPTYLQTTLNLYCLVNIQHPFHNSSHCEFVTDNTIYSKAVVKLYNNVMPRKFHVRPLGSPLVCFQACVVSK